MKNERQVNSDKAKVDRHFFGNDDDTKLVSMRSADTMEELMSGPRSSVREDFRRDY